MSHAVYFMYQQKQRLEPIQKDETLSVITPASEDVAITPRQIYLVSVKPRQNWL